MVDVLEEMDYKLASVFQIKTNPMTSTNPDLKLEMLANLLMLYDDSWTVEGPRVVIGHFQHSPEIKMKKLLVQKRLRKWLGVADLGHLVPLEGELVEGKRFSRLVGGVMDKLEQRHGGVGNLRTKVKNIAAKEARKAGVDVNIDVDVSDKENRSGVLSMSSVASPMASPRSALVESWIPSGKQLPRTPPQDSSSTSTSLCVSSLEENKTPKSEARISSFYSPAPARKIKIISNNRCSRGQLVTDTDFSDISLTKPKVSLPVAKDISRTPEVHLDIATNVTPSGKDVLRTPEVHLDIATKVTPSGKDILRTPEVSLDIVTKVLPFTDTVGKDVLKTPEIPLDIGTKLHTSVDKESLRTLEVPEDNMIRVPLCAGKDISQTPRVHTDNGKENLRTSEVYLESPDFLTPNTKSSAIPKENIYSKCLPETFITLNTSDRLSTVNNSTRIPPPPIACQESDANLFTPKIAPPPTPEDFVFSSENDIADAVLSPRTLLAKHVIPSGRQLSNTPWHNRDSLQHQTNQEPRGVYRLPIELEEVAIPTQEELSLLEAKRLEEQERINEKKLEDSLRLQDNLRRTEYEIKLKEFEVTRRKDLEERLRWEEDKKFMEAEKIKLKEKAKLLEERERHLREEELKLNRLKEKMEIKERTLSQEKVGVDEGKGQARAKRASFLQEMENILAKKNGLCNCTDKGLKSVGLLEGPMKDIVPSLITPVRPKPNGRKLPSKHRNLHNTNKPSTQESTEIEKGLTLKPMQDSVQDQPGICAVESVLEDIAKQAVRLPDKKVNKMQGTLEKRELMRKEMIKANIDKRKAEVEESIARTELRQQEREQKSKLDVSKADKSQLYKQTSKHLDPSTSDPIPVSINLSKSGAISAAEIVVSRQSEDNTDEHLLKPDYRDSLPSQVNQRTNAEDKNYHEEPGIKESPKTSRTKRVTVKASTNGLKKKAIKIGRMTRRKSTSKIDEVNTDIDASKGKPSSVQASVEEVDTKSNYTQLDVPNVKVAEVSGKKVSKGEDQKRRPSIGNLIKSVHQSFSSGLKSDTVKNNRSQQFGKDDSSPSLEINNIRRSTRAKNASPDVDKKDLSELKRKDKSEEKDEESSPRKISKGDDHLSISDTLKKLNDKTLNKVNIRNRKTKSTVKGKEINSLPVQEDSTLNILSLGEKEIKDLSKDIISEPLTVQHSQSVKKTDRDRPSRNCNKRFDTLNGMTDSPAESSPGNEQSKPTVTRRRQPKKTTPNEEAMIEQEELGILNSTKTNSPLPKPSKKTKQNIKSNKKKSKESGDTTSGAEGVVKAETPVKRARGQVNKRQTKTATLKMMVDEIYQTPSSNVLDKVDKTSGPPGVISKVIDEEFVTLVDPTPTKVTTRKSRRK